MATKDAFVEDFKKLLGRIPDDYSYQHWQYAYRQAIYLMGMKILEKFPDEALGLDYAQGDSTKQKEHKQKGGGHPSILCQFTCMVLGTTPTQTPLP